MGIFYQLVGNCLHDDVADTRVEDPQPSSSEPNRKRKRRLDVDVQHLPMYAKKPKMDHFDYDNVNFELIPDVSARARMMDTLFMVGHALCTEKLPMWVGFNARLYEDPIQKQVVLYMPNLIQPITNKETVAETMRIAMKCAAECEQQYGIVTYDLDVAKVAHQIQTTDQPDFDRLFIMFGPFHILMCLFRAIGRMIEESGGPAMLTDSGVLAPGSLRGFMQCSNYNRCKRLHPILATAIEILHFRRFMTEYSKSSEIQEAVRSFDMKSKEQVDQILTSKLFNELYSAYGAFKVETEKGALGKTAQFWIMYVKYISLYLLIERSVRENNIDLLMSSMSVMIDLFFSTNRHNYSRWMSKYQLDLLNLDQSRPGLRGILDAGAFSIRRTDNSYARLPTDLTLEQTVNADAASRLTGTSDCTNNYSGRVRWGATKSSRAALVSEAYSMLGMNNSNDVQSGLSPSRIDRDNADIAKVIQQIESCMNPFTLDVELSLVNISTGKAASDEVTNSLLSIPEEGRRRHTAFVNECSEDPKRFEKPIKKNRLRTFATECATNRKAAPGSKEAQLKCTSSLLGRLAFLAANNNMDLQHVFSYPLTPVPLSMCKNDGTMAHTQKSSLFTHLENSVADHGVPSTVISHIIDGNCLLHTMSTNQPPTYGGLSRNILVAALSHRSSRIDILFDTYESPSIKDAERARRSSYKTTELVILGPEQRRPHSFRKQLEDESFKKQLPTFLMNDWTSQHYYNIFDGKEVFLGVGSVCKRFYVSESEVRSEIVDELQCNHPEADTRIILHCSHADKSVNATPKDIVVRATDTDVLVLLLHHQHRWLSHMWIECGKIASGSHRYVSVSKICSELGESMCAALPGYHAFTGCDYISAFSGKGKLRPLKIVTENMRFQAAFAALSQQNPNDLTVKTLQDFVCAMYGARKTIPLDMHRFNVVKAVYSSKKRGKPLEKLKTINGSNIPPCERELSQHIARTGFVSLMWGNAHLPNINKAPHSGWEEIDGQYEIIWFDGDQLPSELLPSIDVPNDGASNDLDEDYEDDDDVDEPVNYRMDSDTDYEDADCVGDLD